MRIIQLIDSLDAGGAERMAVSYANLLSDKITFSGLISTRKEGALKSKISDKVFYHFLNKKQTIDLKSLFKLKKIIKENKVEILHAHSSSFFLALLLKFIYFKVKIVWHDHYGKSDFLKERPKFMLQFASFFFHKTIVVNDNLYTWNKKELFCKEVYYLSNFPVLEDIKSETILKGINGKRILLLANLRPQKNVEFLIELGSKLVASNSDWTFHVVGKLFNDEYQNKIFKLIELKNLKEVIYFYDSKSDIKNILSQVNIGILTSISEGLPVSILEYGLAKLPVISTNVGQINKIIQNNQNGFLVTYHDNNLFFTYLTTLMNDEDLRINFGNKLKNLIEKEYSSESIITNYLKLLN